MAGSYAVARGVGALASGRLAAWFAAALGCGALYVVVKAVEYAQLFGAGCTLRTDTFYFFYFFTTVFHLMHVLLGMVMLAVVARRAQRGRLGTDEAGRRLAEAVAGYWHRVDLVWLVLFPLLYVLR
ncbi:MAG: cytochrome c oxidase subunit 3 [Methyloversatilis sp.]|uniref:cytochrome c oxidase subunit 3 n=1 Tax=Methyloversatilis sp. TaxID=2569862 RepID=UPI0027374C0E|nr:cytochrome c oxidase subunit 3 [Methyloversatilis sp.]MDP3871026.1 cytochrome c oxidase subunit 3 [Methyloversatilis sp.]